MSNIAAVLFHFYNSPPEDVVRPLPLGIHPSTAFLQGPIASTYDALPEDFS